jgi:hypothetical protein
MASSSSSLSSADPFAVIPRRGITREERQLKGPPTWDLVLKVSSDHSYFGLTTENDTILGEYTYEDGTAELARNVMTHLPTLIQHYHIDYKTYRDFESKGDWSIDQTLIWRCSKTRTVGLKITVDRNNMSRRAHLTYMRDKQDQRLTFYLEQRCWNRQGEAPLNFKPALVVSNVTSTVVASADAPHPTDPSPPGGAPFPRI